MNKSGRWRIGALASAVALLGGLASLDVHALGLGRITVQSALGEPLRAEIEIAEISPEEASSLRAGVAGPDAFKAAGLEYALAVTDLQVSLQKRANGRSYLRLTGARPVSEPFVDLILEASWASGRIVRDYTMLFDPPMMRQPAAPTAPVLSRPAAPSASGLGSIPYSPPAQAARPVPAEPAVRPAPPARPAPVTRAPAEARPAASGQQVTVKAGDTAGKIAAQNKPASVSLDQMLVALLRSNPDAFIGGNINRLKSGAVLDLPSEEQAGAVGAGEASRTIVAQAKNFNEFRRKLAEGVPATTTGSATRAAGGTLEAKVEDRGSAATTPDKLTLSKGAVQSKAATEEKIAKERQAKEAANRVAELSKNINDLNKIGSGGNAPAGAASAAKAPGIAVPAVSSAAVTPPTPAASAAKAPASAAAVASVAAASAALASASAPVAPLAAASASSSSTPATSATSSATLAAASAPAAAASAPDAAASQPVAAAPVAVKKPVVVPPPPPEPSLIDELTENPYVLPGIGALLLLLAGFGVYRYRQRNNSAQVDSSFLESRLQPDSFFGASGGQRIDTNEGGATGSSLVYSPSQLDAAGDVDPVAEADVYLAYGRDLQAEEILKEAMRTNPTRVAIHAKLMEIYAKRRDAKAFEVIAVEAFNLTRGEGSEWAYIGEMGRELDPSNPMYQPGGQPSSAPARAAPTSAELAAAAFGSSTIPQMIEPQHEEPSASVDFDLDLDFSDEPAIATQPIRVQPAAVKPPEPTVSMRPEPEAIFEGLDMDFGTGTVALKPTPAPAPLAFDPAADLALSASGLSFTNEPIPAPAPKAAPAPALDSGMLEFDLGSLSLDLDQPTTESPSIAAAASNGPLETKFALAEEFRSLGDTDGARSLAEEVLAQAQGPLKTKAQAFIKSLA